MPSLSERASWLLFAKTAAYAASLALPLLVVRKLSVLDYGLYKQTFLVVNSAVQLLPLGFTMSAYYFLPREPERRGQIVFNILLYCLAMGGAAWLALALRPSLLTLIFGQAALEAYAPLIGLVIALWIFGACLEIISVAQQDMKLSTVFILGGSLSRTLILIAMTLAFGTVGSLIWGAAIHGALQTAVLLVYLEWRFPKFWRQFDRGMLGTQLSYALPLGVAGMLYTLQTDAHNYFVSHQLGPVVFAAYAVGCFDLQFTSILGEAVNSVLIPAVSLYEKQGESQRIIQLVGNAQRKLAAVFFPTAALLMVVAPEFISFLFTPRYLSAVPIFRINLILLPFNAFTLDALIRSYAQLRFLVVRVRVILFVLLCVALWRGIALYGAVGAISAVVVFSLLERGIIGTVAGRAAGVSRKDASLLKDVAKIAAAAGAAAVVTGLLKGWLPAWKPFPVLALCGAVYGSVYAGAAFALRIATPDEWDTARRSIASALAAAGIRRRPSI